MGKLSTHILDTSLGKPASNLEIKLYFRENDESKLLKTVFSNLDGRCDEALLCDDDFKIGCYELVFYVEKYFIDRKIKSPFLKEVVLRFWVENANEGYHVPLLISPFAYSTYRGS